MINTQRDFYPPAFHYEINQTVQPLEIIEIGELFIKPGIPSYSYGLEATNAASKALVVILAA